MSSVYRHCRRIHASVQQLEKSLPRVGAKLLHFRLDRFWWPFFQYLLETTSSCSSVDAAFYGIKWVHETAGLVSPTDISLVVAVRDASKRILGTTRSNRKEPITPELRV